MDPRRAHFGAAQAGAAVLTGGLSLAAKAGRKGTRGAGNEVIPIRTITSVTTHKDGLTNWAVSIITSGNTIDMRVSKAQADLIKSTLLRLMLD